MTISPLLFDIPTKFETERLLVRAAQPEDTLAMYEAALVSRPQLERWLPDSIFGDYTLDGVGLLIRKRMAQWINREYLMFHTFRRSDGRFVGSCGLHHIDWDVPAFEVGYWVDSRLSGQGYVTEAVTALTRFAFEQLNAERVELHCNALNEPSIKVAKRIGYLQEACLRHHQRDPQGNLADSLIFSIIRADFEPTT